MLLPPFGGLVPWAAFQKQCGLIEALAATCPVRRTSLNAAPVYDVLTRFGLTVLCDGKRFAQVQRLRVAPPLTSRSACKTWWGTTRCGVLSPGCPRPRARRGGAEVAQRL